MFVTPGDKICAVEEFVPGDGAFEENGEVYSASVGSVEYNREEHKVNVVFPKKPAKFNVVGSIVYGRVMQVMDQFVVLVLYPYETRRFRLIPPSKYAAIHISNVRAGFVENLRKEFGVGDWVRARVHAMPHRLFMQLSTVGRQYGIVKGYCAKCRGVLVKKYDFLYCPRCKEKYSRKIAEDYGAPRLPG